VSVRNRFDLSGKIALVTGGSRGIGRGIAIALAEHGADVALVYRSATDQAEMVAEEIRKLGRRAWVYQQDLALTDKLTELVDYVWSVCGRIDILVNNAGMAYLEPYAAITAEHWQQVLAVNLDAVFFLSQQAARRMTDAGINGRIINISSTNGFAAEAGLAHYNASKGGLELLTRSLAIELGVHGITVNTVAPGLIETEIADDFDMDPAFFDYCREHIPLQHRLGKIEDCVGAVVLLASEAGAYITGQHLIIDGGLLCEQFPRMRFMSR
jgi:NAD(P)-dependent dehydrogenase (short-subunit alcohol dehydrogenase family)